MSNPTNSLAAQGQRSGKFRHVYGEPAKPDAQYLELRDPLTSGDGSYCSANNKFFSIAKSRGGVYVIPLSQVGRIPANQAIISVQKGKVWDMDFHPFISTMIATASDDTSVAVSTFPIDGLTQNITQPEVMLKGAEGHQKKATLVKFNKSANSILASASFDRTVKVWDIESQSCINTFKDPKDNIYSLEWNYDGSQLAITGKDKKLRLFDPRLTDEAAEIDSFEGAKTSKCFWLANLGWIGAVGFSKTARRQIKLWDTKDLSKPVFSQDIDQVSSVLMPFYDNDTGLLFLSGKGDGTVSFAEIINDAKKFYPLGAYRNPEPQKGGGWIAKRACDVWKGEIGRFLKLTKNSVIPIQFIVPRKAAADVFQEDIYPDCFAGKPALTAADWTGGQNKDPIMMAMDPAKRSDEDVGGAVFTKKKTYAELEKEVETLQARVKELEQQLGINSKDEEEEEEKKEDGVNNNEQ